MADQGEVKNDKKPTRRRRRSRWVRRRKQEDVQPEQAELFLKMHHRKMERTLNGAQERKSNFQLIALLVLLIIVYGVGASVSERDDDEFIISLELYQLFLIGVWVLLCVIITSVFDGTRFMDVLNWTFIYLPLLASVLAILLSTDHTIGSVRAIRVIFLISEAVVLLIFIGRYYIYPWFLQSPFFSDRIGAGLFFGIHSVSDGGTMIYNGKFGRFSSRYTCQYIGEKNSRGVPHGKGRWYDDRSDGEVLTGFWKNGKPVAPYSSRQTGTGDTFSAVQVAYFKATDDKFDQCNFIPSNNLPPQCGIGSVECSIYGSFYNHLPEATELYGPHVVGEGASIGDCCSQLINLESGEEVQTSVTVHTIGTGVSVDGYIYEPSGEHFSEEPNEIVINVRKESIPFAEQDKSYSFMPLAPAGGVEATIFESDQSMAFDDAVAHENPENTGEADFGVARLEVRNWAPSSQKQALIFFGGFNCCPKKTLSVFGQFVAMTRISAHVYPICFMWPSAKVLTYRHASIASSNSRNRELFLELLQGLSAAGIQQVQLMSHSMGVQSLLAAFEDKSDGSPSDVSLCFKSSFDFRKSSATLQDTDGMVCKNIIMLNPDFPVQSFLDRAFVTIRRICSNITVLGDRGDGALFFSQYCNGLFNYFGYDQPRLLQSNDFISGKKSQGFRSVPVVGRSIDLLHFPSEEQGTDEEEAGAIDDERLVFKDVTPLLLSQEEHVYDRQWLDMDVIDTTLLDTNITELRHSAFNINPFVLNDLRELIITSKRASQRSMLLHREGNIFSYCQAPSFVAY